MYVIIMWEYATIKLDVICSNQWRLIYIISYNKRIVISWKSLLWDLLIIFLWVVDKERIEPETLWWSKHLSLRIRSLGQSLGYSLLLNFQDNWHPLTESLFCPYNNSRKMLMLWWDCIELWCVIDALTKLIPLGMFHHQNRWYLILIRWSPWHCSNKNILIS